MRALAVIGLRRLAATVAAISLAAGGLALAGPAPAFAYESCQTTSSLTVTPTTGSPGATLTVTVTLKDCNGNPAQGVQATFSQQSGPAGCKLVFSSTTAVTDANGQATVTATLPANCPGIYVIQAVAKNVQVQATVRELGGFPNTSSAAIVPAPRINPILLLILGFLLVGGGLASFVSGRLR